MPFVYYWPVRVWIELILSKRWCYSNVTLHNNDWIFHLFVCSLNHWRVCFVEFESLFNIHYISYNVWMLYTPIWWLIVQRQGRLAPRSASVFGFCEQTDGMEILFNAHFSRTNTAVSWCYCRLLRRALQHKSGCLTTLKRPQRCATQQTCLKIMWNQNFLHF